VETPYLGDERWDRSFFDSLDLAVINFYPLGWNHIPKKDNLRGKEVALL